MAFVDEEDLPFVQVTEDRGKVAGPLDRWPGGHADIGLHFARDDVG